MSVSNQGLCPHFRGVQRGEGDMGPALQGLLVSPGERCLKRKLLEANVGE